MFKTFGPARSAPTWCVIMLLLFCALAQTAEASTMVVTWSGSASGRTLSDANYSQALNSLTANGISYGGQQDIVQSVLSNACVFIFNEIAAAPTQAELNMLLAWVNAGGVVFLNTDSGGAPKQPSNDMMAALNIPINFSGFSPGTGVFQAGPFSTGIQGMALNASPGSGVVGGTPIIANSITYYGVGAGFFIAAGDSILHNAVNGPVVNQFVQNFCVNCNTASPSVPEPSALASVALGLGLLAFGLRKKKPLV